MVTVKLQGSPVSLMQVTVVAGPVGKNEPDAGAHETVGVERLSLAGGA